MKTQTDFFFFFKAEGQGVKSNTSGEYGVHENETSAVTQTRALNLLFNLRCLK